MAMTEFKDVDGVKFVNGVATKVVEFAIGAPPSAAGFEANLGPVADNAGKIFFCVKTGVPNTAYFVTSNGTHWFYKDVSLSV